MGDAPRHPHGAPAGAADAPAADGRSTDASSPGSTSATRGAGTAAACFALGVAVYTVPATGAEAGAGGPAPGA